MLNEFTLLLLSSQFLLRLLFFSILFLYGCASTQPSVMSQSSLATVGIPIGFFLPSGVFSDVSGENKSPFLVPSVEVLELPQRPVSSVSGVVPFETPLKPPSLPVVPAPKLVPVSTPLDAVRAQSVLKLLSAPLANINVPVQVPSVPITKSDLSADNLCPITSRFDGCDVVKTRPVSKVLDSGEVSLSGFFLPQGVFSNLSGEEKKNSPSSILAISSPVPEIPGLSKVPSMLDSGLVTQPVPAVLDIRVAAVDRKEGLNPAGIHGGPLLKSGLASDFIEPKVVVYSSPLTKSYLSKVGLNSSIGAQVWSVFLSKYRIPFQVITAVEKLELTSAKVLVLPSSVALSGREKQAVISFRAKGGSVLATWLSGARSDKDSDADYSFMEKVLDVKVLGTTEGDLKDEYLLPHGDSPVTHHLPAGSRVWLERIKGLYPLRLQGRQIAANIMNWSRVPVFGKATSTLVFDERLQPSGRFSRSVVFGYPEQLWLSADPRQLEAIAHNSVMWLLRQPAIYVAAWPFPYRSAAVVAVDLAGAVSESDLVYAKLIEEAGGRGTYYVLSEIASKYSGKLNTLIAAGHEVAYLGDNFSDFRGHSETVQARRLDGMRKAVKDSGVDVAVDAGFHAPMDSYDKITEKLLKTGGFGHLLASDDASQARLPFFASFQDVPDSVGSRHSLVVLPRTQSGPEDSVDNCQPELGIKPFLNELDLSEKMGGLSVVSVSGKSELTDAQSAEIFSHLKGRRDRTWLTTAGQIADWWRERDRVSVRLVTGDGGPTLVVTVRAGAVLRKAPVVLVNLPEIDGTLRLTASDTYLSRPQIFRLDSWRAAIVLDGISEGEYKWNLSFDNPGLGGVE